MEELSASCSSRRRYKDEETLFVLLLTSFPPITELCIPRLPASSVAPQNRPEVETSRKPDRDNDADVHDAVDDNNDDENGIRQDSCAL